MAEQRYRAVLAVVSDGQTVKDVAAAVGVSRQTLHAWLARYEATGLEGLADRSHRPRSCPHQMSGFVEALVLEARRVHPSWGARRIAFEVGRRVPAGQVAPSESGVYRCLRRAGLIEADGRRRRRRDWRRWERGTPMELWQLDLVGGFLLADGSQAKALTGIDDHSRYCVSARLMPRERTGPVCEAFRAALSAHGLPQQVLTDNGRVFTGRFFTSASAPVEVLFDRICRENGIEHLLTQPRSPTTTGKIERFHRTLRAEFDTARRFRSLRAAQGELDEWVAHYNQQRPHQALDFATPASRFHRSTGRGSVLVTYHPDRPDHVDRTGPGWVTRKVASNGVVCVAWQQVSVGRHHAGARCDVLVTDDLLQYWVGDQLLKTVARTSRGEVRTKRTAGTSPRR